MPDRNRHEPAGFNAQQLFEYLSQFTPEERAEAGIFIRVAPEGQTFNIRTLDYVQESTYSFFGHPVACLILNTEDFAPSESEGEEKS